METIEELLSQDDIDGSELITSICLVSKTYISVIRNSAARNDTELMNTAIYELDSFMDKLIDVVKTK